MLNNESSLPPLPLSHVSPGQRRAFPPLSPSANSSSSTTFLNFLFTPAPRLSFRFLLPKVFLGHLTPNYISASHFFSSLYPRADIFRETQRGPPCAVSFQQNPPLFPLEGQPNNCPTGFFRFRFSSPAGLGHQVERPFSFFA